MEEIINVSLLVIGSFMVQTFISDGGTGEKKSLG